MICTAHQILLRRLYEENQMGGACGTYEEQERCIQGFGGGGGTLRKETTWKTGCRWEVNF